MRQVEGCWQQAPVWQQPWLWWAVVLMLPSCGEPLDPQSLPGRVVEPARQVQLYQPDATQAQRSLDALKSDQLVQQLQGQMQTINNQPSRIRGLEDRIIEEITRHDKCLAKDIVTTPNSQTRGWSEAQRATLGACNVLQQLFVLEVERVSSDIACGVTSRDLQQNFELFNIKMAGEFFKTGLALGFWRLLRNSQGDLFVQFANLSCDRIRDYQRQMWQWVQVGLSRGVL